MLSHGKPKPCKPTPIKNVQDIIKGISTFIQYWECMWVVDVGGSFRHPYGTWIGYWIHIRSTLMDLHQISSLTLRHAFWLQSHVDVLMLEARVLGNGEVHEEFNEDEHYVGPASNRSPPSFHVAMDYHEGYMLILSLGDETYGKSYFSTNYEIYSPHFQQIHMEYYQSTTRNEDVIHHSTNCNKNHKFCWRVDFEHGLTWIDMDSIFIA